MYLKKIVLDGFKSFYTRTEIDLTDGIIGIVGPNGCGKSNIYDTVQWVLGEQSAKELRGDEISDVISTGNVRRGAKNYAEAYLTFGNCSDILDTEQDEIEVGRRVERDGSGTYYLNGDKVRLKDIKNLFRDTGIGQDLYSTIGQGEVFSLIESKPEERREIVEEAAGIATYRHRRNLTKNRLEKTQDELNQVDKDLRQKKGRLSQLKGQAEEAKKVRELQKKLRIHKIEVSKRDYHGLNESVEMLRDEVDQAKTKLKKTKKQKKSVQENREKLRQRKQKINAQLENLKSNLNPLRERKQKNQEILSNIKAKVQSRQDRVEREERSIDKNRKRLSKELDNLVEYQKKRYSDELKHSITTKNRIILKQIETKLEDQRRKLNEKLEEIRNQTVFKLSEKNEVEQRFKNLTSQLGETKDALSEHEDQFKNLSNEFASQAEIQNQYENFIEASKRHVEFQRTLARNQMQKSIVGALKNRKKSNLEELRSTVNRKKNRAKNLSRQLKNYEGFNPGVKRIMETHAANKLDGIQGILADLIDVPEEYQTPLRATLNGCLQGIVVDSKNNIRNIMKFVKREEIGPVTLLLQDGMDENNYGVSEEVISDSKSYLGMMSEIVECENDIQHLCDRLLGRTALVTDLTEALSWVNHFEIDSLDALVTMNGAKIDKNGKINIVEASDNENEILQRRKKKERLEKDIKRHQETLDSLKKEYEKLSLLDQRLEKVEDQINSAKGGLKDEKRNYRDTLRKKNHQFEKRKDEKKRLLSRLISLQKKYNHQKTKRMITRKVFSQMKNINEDQNRKSRQIKDRLNKLDRKYNSIRDEIQFWNRNEERLQAQIEEGQSQIEELNNRREKIIDSIMATNEERKEVQSEKLLMQRKQVKFQLQQDFYQKRYSVWIELKKITEECMDREGEDLDEINRKLQKLERRTERRRGKLNQLQSEIENKQKKLEDKIEFIQENFDIDLREETFDQLANTNLDDISRHELEETIEEIQAQIKEFQPVNMLADKEAQELSAEVEDIENQKNDLEQASQKIQSVISRLNQKAREQFQEAFEEIKEYFSDFIGELFQGGEGRLGLTDDPVLEAGVTIEIKPPGESLKNMNALSGGEKTLGALAFLFALYEHKSTPFCFLDEVDQSFDDENVNKFVNLLVRYKQQTQFLVITHNKLTMQAADKLFGVTMEESGVTSVVPMEIDQAEELREPEQATA